MSSNNRGYSKLYDRAYDQGYADSTFDMINSIRSMIISVNRIFPGSPHADLMKGVLEGLSHGLEKNQHRNARSRPATELSDAIIRQLDQPLEQTADLG